MPQDPIDISALHREALAATGLVVGSIGPQDWSKPTPCAEWDVRDLLNHLVAGNLWAAELAAGATIEEVGDHLDGDVLGDDPAGAYDRSAESAAAAFERPGALEAPCAVSYGPVPGSVYAGHRFIDVLVHGWDLATAIGGDIALPAPLVAACIAVVEPQEQMLGDSGAFGSPTDPGRGVEGQTRLLAMLGRAPSG